MYTIDIKLQTGETIKMTPYDLMKAQDAYDRLLVKTILQTEHKDRNLTKDQIEDIASEYVEGDTSVKACERWVNEKVREREKTTPGLISAAKNQHKTDPVQPHNERSKSSIER